MSFPASVEQVTSGRLRRKQTRQRTRLYPWEDQLPEAGEDDARAGTGGPILDIGRDGGATIKKIKGRWEWSWLKEESNAPTLSADEGVLLYPACRAPEVNVGGLPASKVADSAVDYVRALPDVSEYASISDLVTEELAEMSRMPKLDVYKGETLAVISQPRVKNARLLLAFPVGPIGNLLNISPFLPRSGGKRHRPYLTTFRPMPKGVEKFSTEILQLSSSSIQSGSRLDRETTALLVRLHVSTYLLNVGAARISCSDQDSTAEVTRVGELSHTDTEGRRHVDAMLDETTWSRALIVDEGGGVWLWYEEKVEVRERLVKTMQLRKIRDAVSHDRHGFFRIAFGSRPGTALVMSSKTLTVIDIENQNTPETLIMSLSGGGRRFTSLDKSAPSRRAIFTCVATTHEVIWVDELKGGCPVVTWRHDYGGGLLQDLRLNVIQTSTTEFTLLSSSSSSLIMTFRVSSSPPVRSDQSPQCLALRGAMMSTGTQSLVGLPLGAQDCPPDGVSHLVTYGSDGAVQSFEFRPPSAQAGEMDVDDAPVMRRQHPEPLWDYYNDSSCEKDESHTQIWLEKAKTKHKVLDLRDIWLDLNRDPLDPTPSFTFRGLEQHLRELDAPLDSFVTLGDLARDAIFEEEGGRSHVLRPIGVDTDTIGSDIVTLDDIDVTRHDLTAVAKLPDDLATSSSAGDLITTFAERITVHASGRQGRIKEDTFRLVLDLTLSRMIVHSESPTSVAPTPRGSQEPQTADNLFERAEQLTLDDGTSKANEIPFRWLPPRRDIDAGSPNDHDLPSDHLQTEAARTLLSEWTIGADPIEYDWKDWRREGSLPRTPIKRPVRPLPSPRTTYGFAQSQPDIRYRPPYLSQPQPRQLPPYSQHANAIPQVFAHTQAMRSSPPPVLQSSQSLQDLGPSTQAERGPYGGRPEVKARKKAVKKRIGGF